MVRCTARSARGPRLRSLDRDFADYAFVRHGLGEWGRGPIRNNTIKVYFGICKRDVNCVYQHCARRHLHRYAEEFEFRYNNRVANGIAHQAKAV